MSRGRRRPKLPQGEFETTIESLSHDGRGVTHIDGKAIFIDGALAGEKIEFQYTGKQRNFDEGSVTKIIEASEDRVEPECEAFGICGGCSLQHLDAEKQIAFKQQAMLDGLKHIGGVQPETILDPIRDSVWGYRRKARLGVRYVHKKGRVLVGFRERRNSFITNVTRCPVLHPSVGEKLEMLGEFIGGLEAKAVIPQIEVAATDAAVAMVFRHLEPLSDSDFEQFVQLQQATSWHVYLQSGGYHTVKPLGEAYPPLSYEHPLSDIKVEFHPLDFTQVNDGINRKMVAQALAFLELDPEDKVLDLFCGLGNFTLPIARKAAEVTGVEGDQAMIERARETAVSNDIHNTRYHVTNLMESLEGEPWLKGDFNKVLLDPPRSGAWEVLEPVAKMKPERIVYVSCHPGTLARDAGELVNKYGYKLTHAGVMDMFPHTAHVESMAVFVKG